MALTLTLNIRADAGEARSSVRISGMSGPSRPSVCPSPAAVLGAAAASVVRLLTELDWGDLMADIDLTRLNGVKTPVIV